jgi:site-specific DNA-methyltransferase (adenine-specific)
MNEQQDIFSKVLKTVNNDIYYKDDALTFYKGDIFHILKKYVKDKTIDIIVTSPPYNLSVKYNTYKDNLSRKEYLLWIEQFFIEMKRVLKDDGSFFLNVGSSSKDPWIDMDVAISARKYFMIQNRFTWVKSISVANKKNDFDKKDFDDREKKKETSYGQFTPINSKKYVNKNTELIFHFTKSEDVEIDKLSIGVPYVHPSNYDRWKEKGKEKRCRGNAWFIPYDTINSKGSRGYHPAIFPEKIPEWCIKIHGYNKNSVVLDPFLGSGTTLKVVKLLGVNGVGIDMDDKYIKNSIRRVTGYEVENSI